MRAVRHLLIPAKFVSYSKDASNVCFSFYSQQQPWLLITLLLKVLFPHFFLHFSFVIFVLLILTCVKFSLVFFFIIDYHNNNNNVNKLAIFVDIKTVDYVSIMPDFRIHFNSHTQNAFQHRCQRCCDIFLRDKNVLLIQRR